MCNERISRRILAKDQSKSEQRSNRGSYLSNGRESMNREHPYQGIINKRPPSMHDVGELRIMEFIPPSGVRNGMKLAAIPRGIIDISESGKPLQLIF